VNTGSRRASRVSFLLKNPPSHEVTELLKAWSQGDQGALEQLTPLVYEELRRAAHRHMMGESPGHTLQTTALVNEAYVRLLDSAGVSWRNRAHFFAVCAQLMRRILTDFARSQLTVKRGAAARHLSLDESIAVSADPQPELIALDEALSRLAAFDRRKGRIVELRFFGGLTVDDTAEVLQVSRETVLRDWRLAKAWLLRELGGEQKDAT